MSRRLDVSRVLSPWLETDCFLFCVLVWSLHVCLCPDHVFSMTFICSVSMFPCVHMYTCTHVEVRGQPAGFHSLLPSCGSQRLDLVCQAWWQVPQLAEPPYWPKPTSSCKGVSHTKSGSKRTSFCLTWYFKASV